MTYPTCGEISCEECNDRYEQALARIAELEQMVRELLSVISQAEDDAWTKNQLMYSTAKMMRDCRTKALALLQPKVKNENTL